MTTKLFQILIPYHTDQLDLLGRLLNSVNIQKHIDLSKVAVTILSDDIQAESLDKFCAGLTTAYTLSIQTKPYSGISSARNQLLAAAMGQYVMFCDCNDYFLTDSSLAHYFYAIQAEGLGVPADVLVAPILYQNTAKQPAVVNKNKFKLNGTSLRGKVFRRSFLLENDIYFLPCLDGVEDYSFVWLAMQLSAKTAYITGNPLYCWDSNSQGSATPYQSAEWFLGRLPLLTRASTLLVQTLLDRDLSDSAAIAAAMFLRVVQEQLQANSGDQEAISLDEAYLHLNFYIKQFGSLLLAVPECKKQQLYTSNADRGSAAQEVELCDWCTSISTRVATLKAVKTKNSFSVIIPTHNRGRLLLGAIKSVVDQSYPDYEIIVCDDHSTANIKPVLELHYRGLIKAGKLRFYSSQGRGAGAARNTALQLATKDWIVYLDDDNKQQPNFLETFNFYINSFPDKTCFYGRWLNRVNKKHYYPFTEFNYQKLLVANYIDVGVFVHKRELFAKYGGFTESLTALEDWELILRYTRTEPTLGIDAIVLDYSDEDHDRITNTVDFSESLYKVRRLVQNSSADSLATLIISYNQERYIRQALDSAVSQVGDFRYEILVSDDCSTDATPQIIQEYVQRYPGLIRNISPKTHLGLTGNYWHAIAQVKQDYLAILEGDDYWHPEKLSKSIALLRNNPEVSLVFAKIDLYHELSGKFLPHRIPLPDKTILTDADLVAMHGSNFVTTLSNCVFKTSVFENFPLDAKTKFMFSEIPLQFFITGIGGQIGQLKEKLVTYRIHSGGVWSGASLGEQEKIFYDTRRAAFTVASLAGKRHLFSLLKPLQADLLTHGSITESEIKELDMEYKALNLKSKTKGIILAGGTGSRLYPTTEGAAKALLPVYDKPLIYYPLSILMLAQIQDILLIASPEHLPGFKRLLGDGSKFGVNLSYAVQESPQGIPDAFKVGKSFIGSSDVVLILGDNIFHGATLINSLQHSMQILSHGQGSIYSYHVKNPERFGVLAYNDAGEPIEIEEKPAKPKSNYCVTGLYFYPNDVTTQADTLTPSKRGELEITDLNNLYLYQDRLQVERLGRGCVWFDTGTPEALLQAANFVSTVQNNENLIIACLEEIAFTNGWISKEALVARGQALSMTEYGRYLLKLAENN